MQNNFKYINLSWAVVGICERPRVGDQRSGMNPHQPLLSHIPGIDKDEAFPPLLPRSSSPTHRPDGTRRHELRVSDVK